MTYSQLRDKKISLRERPMLPSPSNFPDDTPLLEIAEHYDAHGSFRVGDKSYWNAFLDRANALARTPEIEEEIQRLWDLGVSWQWFSEEASEESIKEDEAAFLLLAKVRHLLRKERPLIEFALMQEEEAGNTDILVDLRSDEASSLIEELYRDIPYGSTIPRDKYVTLRYALLNIPKDDQTIIDEVLIHLGAAQIVNGDIFRRGPALIQRRGNSLITLDVGSLAEAIATLPIYDSCQPIKEPIDTKIVSGCLRRKDYPGYRELKGSVRHPIIDRKGRVIDRPGYNKQYQLFIANEAAGYRNNRFDKVKDPEERAKAAAAHIMDEVLFAGDDKYLGWPFVSKADRANAFALALTPFLRPTIETAPAALLLRKSPAGTGTTLLAESLMSISLGREVEQFKVKMPDEEEELEKMLFSMAKDAAPIIFFDNVRRKLNSPGLESFMTATMKGQRVFHTQSMARYPNISTVVITGNKGDISSNTDMKRRSYPIVMDAKVEEPWIRPGTFKHDPSRGDSITDWVAEHQRELMGDILAMASSWHEAGNPQVYRGPILGKFEAWCYTIGNILTFAGVPGFLENLPEFYGDADPERSALVEVYSYLDAELNGDWLTARDIYDRLNKVKDNVNMPASFLATLRKDNANGLGKVLQNRIGDVVNGLRIKKKPGKDHIILYSIERVDS